MHRIPTIFIMMLPKSDCQAPVTGYWTANSSWNGNPLTINQAQPRPLWINGPAGYGKTILSTSILRNLQEESQTPVAFFFFSFDLEDRADPFAVVRSWLSQLISQNHGAFQLACEKQVSQIGKTASTQDLLELFNATVQKIPNCTFLVDGLDECTSKGGWSSTESKSLAGFIRATAQALSGTHSRMLVVSREDRDIREGFYGRDSEWKGLEITEYRITPADVEPDATLFSRHIVDQKLRNKPQEMRDGISQRIVSRCDSMFLRIKLLENDLRSGKSQRSLERIVDQVPTQLGQLYDRNWERILEHDSDRKRAFAILRWVAFALRPMTVLEITEAVLLEDDGSANNMEDELPDAIDEDYIKTEIVDLCASLLETRATDTATSLGAKTLHLTHFTVRQYLLDHLPISGTQLIAESRAAAKMQDLRPLSLIHTQFTVRQYILCCVSMKGTQMTGAEKIQSTNELTHSNILAEMCLRYILLPQAWEDPREGADDIKGQRNFRQYAADYWHANFKDGFPNADAVMSLIAELFKPNNRDWESWRQYHDTEKANLPLYKAEVGETKPTNRLYYAASLGLQRLVEQMLESGNNHVDCVDASRRSALLAAAETSQSTLLRYLLGKGASPNIGTSIGRTPLHAAVKTGDIEMTRLLLDRGASWNKGSSPSMHTPFGLASAYGYIDIVQIFLDRGADPAFTDDEGWTPLLIASSHGHLEVVRLLLDQGADHTAKMDRSSTSLHFASSNGHLEVARLLLDRGADHAAIENDGLTSLILASMFGQLEVARLLIDRGADLETANDSGMTPLHSVSMYGHLEVARLLLDRGAKHSATDGNRNTPLLWSILHGHLEVPRLLLERGANHSAVGEDEQTPLICATRYNHLEVARLLLDQGADPSLTWKHGWTPLIMASIWGHLEVARLLLDHDSNLIEVSDENGKGSLHSASEGGRVEVVRLLLERSAEVEAQDDSGLTPLASASYEGHAETVRLLLDHGAELTPTYDGSMPLELATRQGHAEIIQIFMDEGADWAAPSKADGLTVMHRAAFYNHTKIIRQLLAKDSQAWAKRDAFGRLPIYWSVIWEQREAFQTLIEHQSSLDETDRYGSSLVSAAARCGDLDMLEQLLSIPQDNFNAADEFGRTPIWWAERQGQEDVICRLKKEVAAGLGSIPSTPHRGSGKPMKFEDSEINFCDVCCANTEMEDEFFVCSICFPPSFLICLECQKLGAHCLDQSHSLFHREGSRG